MGTPADIQKLIGNMQRAGKLTDRAVNSGTKGETIMNNFEQTLNRFDDHMGKVDEYGKTLDAMMAVTGNGGPPLETTFSSTAVVASPGIAPAVTPPIHHETGDPVK